MKNNILFYGSCQNYNLYTNDLCGRSFLRDSLKDFNVTTISCYSTDISEEDLNIIVKNSDCIITLPISENYRDKNYLSFKYILENVKETCKIIVFAPLDFDLYFFDQGHLSVNNKLINLPADIHLKTLFKYYSEGRSIQNFLDECFYNENFKNNEELELVLNNCLSETKKREDLALNLMSNRDNCYLIPMRQFFMDKHRNFMLHNTHNHPTSVTFVYMAEYILNIIGMDTNKIDRQTDPFGHCTEIYGNKQSYPLYSCVKKHLNFDTSDYKSCFYGTLNEGNKLIDIKDACEIYYESYKNLNL